MAAAYAALLSLNSTIDQFQHPPFPDVFQVESLRETITFLLKFFEDHHDSKINKEKILELERETTEAAYDVDFVIGCHAVDRKLVQNGEDSSEILSAEEIQAIMTKFDSIKEKALEILDLKEIVQVSRSFTPAGPSISYDPGVQKNAMVGFEKHLNAVANLIIRSDSPRSKLQILPIVGMAGIGKTTLTRNVYDSQLIKKHFRVRLWSTVSQVCNVQDIVKSFLDDVVLQDVYAFKAGPQADYDELLVTLNKSLRGTHYLIVMDDVWDNKVWDEIKRCFPDNKNGSTIIITTRLLSVASYIGSRVPYELGCLDEEESWNLLKERVFGQYGCPSTLENTGRKIATSCKGLPLAIVVIAGQLTRSDMTKESWETVAGDINSILNSGDDSLLYKMLCLSYDNLPIHLKPCFLYMGVFPEDFNVSVFQLIKLWVAEGVVRPIQEECIDDTAVKYLTDLAERNLILVSARGSRGMLKYIKIHDFLRDLCLRKAQESNFLRSSTYLSLDVLRGVERHYPLYLLPMRHRYFKMYAFELASQWDFSVQNNLMHFGLRSIHLSAAPGLLASISRFENLQTLSMEDIPGNETVILPPQIWKLQLLRHLEIQRVVLPNPPSADAQVNREDEMLKNMQTLLNLHNFKLTDEVLKRIPNLKKLKLTYTEVSSNLERPCYHLDNLSRLRKLELLSLSMCERISKADISLPLSLKKLSLDGCKLPWEDMSIVGSLLSLEVLRLKNDAFCGGEWTPIEGEFCRLRTLHLQNMSLEHWVADSRNFPSLERLIFYNVWRLKEIPLSIGVIETLQFISIQLCSVDLIRSAKQQKMHKNIWGNSGFNVHISRQTTMEQLPFILFWLPQLFLPEGPDLTFEVENHKGPRLTAETENLEYDLRLLNSFLSYTTKKGIRKSEKLKELAGHIQDVMFKAENICNAILTPIDIERISLSDYCRGLLSVVKEIECISVRVQRILLAVANPDPEVNKEYFQLYEDPIHLLNITRGVKATSLRDKQICHDFNHLITVDGQFVEDLQFPTFTEEDRHNNWMSLGLGSWTEVRRKGFKQRVKTEKPWHNGTALYPQLFHIDPAVQEKLESIPFMVQGVLSDDPNVLVDASAQFRKLLSIEHSPPIDEVIRAGVIPRFVEFLGRHDLPQVQSEAAWILSSVAAGTSDHTTVVVDHGAVPLFVQLLSSSSEDVQKAAIRALGNIAGNSPSFRDLVLGHGALMPLLTFRLISRKP